MEFPFEKTEKYFNAKELKHMEKFMEVEPQERFTYMNAKEQKRVCMRVHLPTGLITESTVFATRGKDNVKVYHTPRATNAESRMAKIAYYEDKDNPQICSSAEWLKWLGAEYIVEEYEPAPETPVEKQRKIAQIAMTKKSLGNMDDEHNKGAEWENAVPEKNI